VTPSAIQYFKLTRSGTELVIGVVIVGVVSNAIPSSDGLILATVFADLSVCFGIRELFGRDPVNFSMYSDMSI
jgi:hypothetical protein